ncbi:SDR family oxidoreductase [Rhodopseudomonas palustris]|uniref:Possible oxo-acyl acyl carrier protein dehydrogenase n=1 Tax=Rhodopseudomonas palustris (strain ATCC BAA-98 / CGA009) TaxID=258594 RepID=Q6N2J9_RHOPA|nr:SDR family oxidoreductase [Rhodopseudomonas palustris]OPF92540.1 oxidoreductase [Rhodopseudomonas palustris]PPQ43483.1 NAD(P)-dependent oxidoreductase [Rhodopseudomonas palustris]QQM05613.1 3-oxoacyl-[acyl-carrier-protein] reductase FabG [Rhodopseudomonas palustris]RJF63844.1 SDR family oxidoreductase [Rhodopseudomonas palustris]WAB76944.1 SDR family NAD(P)-dependent oxidoreductase [Rhodopseudomonas palustris]
MSAACATVAVFGATGAIGRAICEWFTEHRVRVVAIGRAEHPPSGVPCDHWLSWDAERPDNFSKVLAGVQLDAAVWAQGANYNDNIRTFDIEAHKRIYTANVTYILVSLQMLLNGNLLAPTAKLCIISSIWQNIAKQNKMSYGITKAALQGLVQSLAIDLGGSGILVNAVLPGALDTPMTRANLSSDQIARLEQMSPLGSLPSLADVCNLIGFLCSEANTGITGQFIAADRGLSYARLF